MLYIHHAILKSILSVNVTKTKDLIWGSHWPPSSSKTQRQSVRVDQNWRVVQYTQIDDISFQERVKKLRGHPGIHPGFSLGETKREKKLSDKLEGSVIKSLEDTLFEIFGTYCGPKAMFNAEIWAR